MRKKSVAATLVVLFSSLLFAVIGASFSAFVYSSTKIEVNEVKVVASGIEVFSDKNLKTKASSLKLSSMDLGLKPATGKVDEETLIPSTITDEGTSEGYYASVYVPAGTNFSVTVKNIKIETKLNQIEANEQRKNIYVSIKGVKNSTKTLKEDEFELAKFENVQVTQKLTFLIWLGSLSGKELEGAKISFELNFVKA